jgi:hypothetical protein
LATYGSGRTVILPRPAGTTGTAGTTVTTGTAGRVVARRIATKTTNAASAASATEAANAACHESGGAVTTVTAVAAVAAVTAVTANRSRCASGNAAWTTQAAQPERTTAATGSRCTRAAGTWHTVGTGGTAGARQLGGKSRTGRKTGKHQRHSCVEGRLLEINFFAHSVSQGFGYRNFSLEPTWDHRERSIHLTTTIRLGRRWTVTVTRRRSALTFARRKTRRPIRQVKRHRLPRAAAGGRGGH